MRSEDLAQKISVAFGDVPAPPFDKFLEKIMYVRGDQEPVEFLREIYPCSDVLLIDRFKLEEILMNLTVEAYHYVIPRILIYIMKVGPSEALSENFSIAYMKVLDIRPEQHGSPIVWEDLRQKTKAFYSRLTMPQQVAVTSVFQWILDQPDIDGDDRAIFEGAIDFLNKRER